MTSATTSPAQRVPAADAAPIEHLRGLSVRALARMYIPEQRLFAHCLRRVDNQIRLEGQSVRYTAMVLIGLAREPEKTAREILGGASLTDVCDRMLAPDRIAGLNNLGDVAVAYWAARRLGYANTQAALKRMRALLHGSEQHETVEVSWVLAGLSEADASGDAIELREDAARRVMAAYVEKSGLFAHLSGGSGGSLRAHVACFADLVYPVHSLSRYHMATNSADAIRMAEHCGQRMADLIGSAGQWWWHYDVRTGDVIEGYPVYSVHQDAMAPMALFTLAEAGGRDHSDAIAKGLAWLRSAPEINGHSLVDDEAGLIWRKVARREPRKFVRRAQAVASQINSGFRWPGMNLVFPAGAIDAECRPYHLGWLLYAWPEQRAKLDAFSGANIDAHSA